MLKNKLQREEYLRDPANWSLILKVGNLDISYFYLTSCPKIIKRESGSTSHHLKDYVYKEYLVKDAVGKVQSTCFSALVDKLKNIKEGE